MHLVQTQHSQEHMWCRIYQKTILGQLDKWCGRISKAVFKVVATSSFQAGVSKSYPGRRGGTGCRLLWGPWTWRKKMSCHMKRHWHIYSLFWGCGNRRGSKMCWSRMSWSHIHHMAWLSHNFVLPLSTQIMAATITGISPTALWNHRNQKQRSFHNASHPQDFNASVMNKTGVSLFSSRGNRQVLFQFSKNHHHAWLDGNTWLSYTWAWRRGS